MAKGKPAAPRAKSCTAFARDVLGRRYSPAQLVYQKVAADGIDPCQLEGREREIARELFGDVETVPSEARRIRVAYFGRDSFKSGMAIDTALYRMMSADVSKCGPGEVPLAIVASPDLKTSRLSVRRALALVKASRDLAPLLIAETTTGFLMRRPDGQVVGFEALAASRGGASLRGRPILCLIMDESDFFYSGDGFVRTDDEMFHGAIPRLMKDGFVQPISTPWGDESRTRKYFADNFGAPKTALAARASTLLMRDNDPEIAVKVAAELASDPENARREFFCDFSTAGSSRFFPAEVVDAAIDHSLELPALGMTIDSIGAGWDLAQIRDSATQVIVGARGGHFTALSMRELQPRKGAPLKLSTTIELFAADAKPFGVTAFMADQHARQPAREYTDAAGLTIVDAPAGQTGKVETHLHAKKLLAEGHVTIPPGRLAAQLRAITATQTPGGGLSISSPRRAGSHGDLASSFILALWTAAFGVSRDDYKIIPCGVSERGRGGAEPYRAPADRAPGERVKHLGGGHFAWF
jgi:hypothetical protein